jgi:hypothetical protein
MLWSLLLCHCAYYCYIRPCFLGRTNAWAIRWQPLQRHFCVFTLIWWYLARLTTHFQGLCPELSLSLEASCQMMSHCLKCLLLPHTLRKILIFPGLILLILRIFKVASVLLIPGMQTMVRICSHHHHIMISHLRTLRISGCRKWSTLIILGLLQTSYGCSEMLY